MPRRPQARRRRDMRTPTCRCDRPGSRSSRRCGDPRPLDEDIAYRRRDHRRGHRGHRDGVLHAAVDRPARPAARARPRRARRERPQRRAAHHLLRAPLHDIAVAVRRRPGDRGSARVRRRARPARPARRRDGREGARRAVHRPHGHVQRRTTSMVHLRNNRLRRHGGLRIEPCVVSEEAAFLSTRSRRSSRSSTPSCRRRGSASCSRPTTTATGRCSRTARAAPTAPCSCQQVLAYLERRYPDRLRFADRTEVERVVVGPDGVELHANRHRVRAARVVLCTNGYTPARVEDDAGTPLVLHPEQQVAGTTASWRRSPRSNPARPPR